MYVEWATYVYQEAVLFKVPEIKHFLRGKELEACNQGEKMKRFVFNISAVVLGRTSFSFNLIYPSKCIKIS